MHLYRSRNLLGGLISYTIICHIVDLHDHMSHS
ncbi:hypothetical protein LINGRAHAP2_LOCUS30797 [Linum grandiflorum]